MFYFNKTVKFLTHSTKKKHSFKDLNSGRIDIAKITTEIKLAHLIFFLKAAMLGA